MQLPSWSGLAPLSASTIFFCDGHYAATTLLVLSNVYQHWG